MHEASVRDVPRRSFGPNRRLPGERRRWALGQLATAALVLLTLAAGYVALGPLRPGTGGRPPGNLWVADGNHDRFQILAPDGTHLETWGTQGSGKGQFEFTAPESGFGVGYGDVAFDGAGNLYVVDTGNHRVQKFAPDRAFLL